MPRPAGELPDPVDLHVGAQMRALRKRNQLTQTGLAEHLGITFQQVQKYERGSNRVSASMLWRASEKLGVPVEYFFDGLPTSVPKGATVESTRVLEAMNAPGVAEAAFQLVALDRDARAAAQDVIFALARRQLPPVTDEEGAADEQEGDPTPQEETLTHPEPGEKPTMRGKGPEERIRLLASDHYDVGAKTTVAYGHFDSRERLLGFVRRTGGSATWASVTNGATGYVIQKVRDPR